MKLSGELDYRIRYDVEHDLFHAQNVFNDEYIQPTFIEYVQNLEKENAELKADNDARKFAMAMSEKVEKQLREENAKLKDEWQEQIQKATDEGYARTLQTIQLSKAKNLLAKWVELFKPKSKTALPTPIQIDTEQFLNGEGCPDCFCEDCTKEDCKARQIGLDGKVK